MKFTAAKDIVIKASPLGKKKLKKLEMGLF